MARRDADWLNTETITGYTALTRVLIIAVPGHLKELCDTTNFILTGQDVSVSYCAAPRCLR